METKIKSNFKAVDFMRMVRSDLSGIYLTDKQRYYDELNKSMEDFLKLRKKIAASDKDKSVIKNKN